MAFRLQPGESIPEAVARIVAEEVDSAVDQLSRSSVAQRDDAIHEARKSIKKIRGLLRLLRPELGKTYQVENGRLRDAGRLLSELRDAGAIIGTFDDLVKKYHNELKRDGLQPIRRGLEAKKHEAESNLNVSKVMKQSASALRALKRRLPSWPLSTDGFKAIAPGLKATYKNGRVAMKQAVQDGEPNSFHEWRKRAKDHWYHVRLMENLWVENMQARESSLHDLESWLGDDHNLVVLRDQLESDPNLYGGDEPVALFAAIAVQEQDQLRKNATSLGNRIYEQKPAVFMQDAAKLWDIWQKQPSSTERKQKLKRENAKSGSPAKSSVA